MTNRMKLLNYEIELVDIHDFKEFYTENLMKFVGIAEKSFLKAVDIPPAYFLEQPESTKETLLNNKEERIDSLVKKYAGKCIVVLWQDGVILNVCRMDRTEAELSYEQLSSIDEVEGIIWNRTFYKEGYIQGYIPIGKVNKDVFNNCLVIDFPILLNKEANLHSARFKMPNAESRVQVDIFYNENTTSVDFMDFQHISLAIEDGLKQATDVFENVKALDQSEDSVIMKDHEELVCQLLEDEVIPKTLYTGLLAYLDKYIETDLTINTLTEIILSFEGNLKVLKQVNQIRECYGYIYQNFYKPVEELIA